MTAADEHKNEVKAALVACLLDLGYRLEDVRVCIQNGVISFQGATTPYTDE